MESVVESMDVDEESFSNLAGPQKGNDVAAAAAASTTVKLDCNEIIGICNYITSEIKDINSLLVESNESREKAAVGLYEYLQDIKNLTDFLDQQKKI